jgi:hypothetical protein
LQSAFEFLALAVDCGQVIICEFSPLLFDPALHLFPIPFNSVPVHLLSPAFADCMNAEGTEVFPILVYCSDYKLSHSAIMRQDEVRISEPLFVCQACGI